MKITQVPNDEVALAPNKLEEAIAAYDRRKEAKRGI